MDRFIGTLTLSVPQQMKYLKSNMDRFIDGAKFPRVFKNII